MLEVQPNIFRLEIPLRNSPLRFMYPYLIRGAETGGRNLLVDTAFNTDECAASLASQMADLGVSPEDTDVFVTHAHWDHCGLIGRLKRPENAIFASSVDHLRIDMCQDNRYAEWRKLTDLWSGMDPRYALTPEGRVGFRGGPGALVPVTEKNPGAHLNYGGYDMTVVDLAGHTPGQVGLWHEETGALFCGDHILEHISPNISVWDLDNDYLTIFCDNLRRAGAMGVRHLYSAHGALLTDASARCDELIAHHQARLAETLSVVAASGSPVTAYQVAHHVEWAHKRPFAEMPPLQKWFASSETLAHLQTLAFTGKVNAEKRGECLFYSQK
jgi:glyoxylase-like metal-dependent hydrolase (beta-lactamase superfamily II)